MKQILFRTPTKPKQKNIYQGQQSQGNKIVKTRYKSSLAQINNQSASPLQQNKSNFQGKIYKEGEIRKRVATQIQNKSRKSYSLLKRKISAQNQRCVFMNKIRNQIMSNNKFNQAEFRHLSFQNQQKNNEDKKLNTLYQNYQQKSRFTRNQQQFDHSKKQNEKQFNNEKKFYSTFIKGSKQQKKGRSFQQLERESLIIYEKEIEIEKQRGCDLSFSTLKQKKLSKYIDQYQRQTQKQLQQLQKFANDKHHKKSGKIGIALQRISQKRNIYHQITQTLKKNLLQVNKIEPNNQSNKKIQPIYLNTKQIVQSPKQKQEQQSQNIQRINSISMVQEPPKMTVQQIDNQLDHTVKDFFREYQSLIEHKKEVYERFRNEIVYQFPQMLDKYKSYEIKVPDKIFQSLNQIQPKDQRITKKSIKLRDSKLNQSFASTSKLSHSKQKQQTLDIKNLFQLIFKRAYFYSKSKNKIIQTKTPLIKQQVKQQRKQQRKVKYSYLNYLKDKSKHNNLKKLKITKGRMLIKSKQTILAIENQGSKQHQNLKACIEDAIQDCLKQFDITKKAFSNEQKLIKGQINQNILTKNVQNTKQKRLNKIKNNQNFNGLQ